jgi:translation initiation factor IF-2
MKVTDLAKELDTTPEVVLTALKSLKLKAKGDEQELSIVVASVVKSHLGGILPKKEPTKATEKPKEDKKTVVKKTAKKAVKKKVVKKVETSEKVEKEEVKSTDESKPKKRILKKRIIKKIIKKVVKKKDTDGKEQTQVATKPKKVMSSEPVITLKPLGNKRRKQSRDGRGDVTDQSKEFNSLDAENSSPDSEEQQIKNMLEQDALPEIEIQVPINIKDLAVKLQQKPSAILMTLMQMGIMANINQLLDADIVNKIANKFGSKLGKIKSQEEKLVDDHVEEAEDPSLLENRAPVVTLMGHVDHGKTTLLDYLRKSKVASGEHGGITQHMGAYSIKVKSGKITFLDTPGHEAFTAMRSRGVHITDIVILVVAANDGIMPQTQEAIDHARAGNVPIVVAVTKIDEKNANIDRVKQQLSEVDLASEYWGGKTTVVGVSGITGEGVDDLLELILLETEMLELKANPKKRASGIVVEAHLSQGKGVVATLIVQSGTL